MTLKVNAKFKGNLTCGFSNDIKYLVNFHASSWEFGNLHVDGLLLSKAYKVLDEQLQKSCLMTLKSDAKFEEKLTLGSRNNMRNMVNFNASSSKSEKVQKSYLSWYWRVIQTLKKNYFFVWKLTWGIWLILVGAVKSLNICTLMGYSCWKCVMFELKNYRGVVL